MSEFQGDPRQILGVSPDATPAQIRRAYRRLAMKHHPDRNPNDPEAQERFKEIQWAYRSLIAQKRTRKMAYHSEDLNSMMGDASHPFWSFFSGVREHFSVAKDSGLDNKDAQELTVGEQKQARETSD